MTPSRRTLARVAAAALVVALLVPAGVAALTHEPVEFKPGTVTERAGGDTVVGIQGFHFRGVGSSKKPARLLSVTPNGTFDWSYAGGLDRQWFYDVDPMANGHLFVVTPNADRTVVGEYDPDARRMVWTERFDIHDTHDADLLPNGDVVVANMRETEDGVANDRVFVYNRTLDEVTWEWRFRDHFPNDTDGGFSDDWTHLNDVDYLGGDRFLLSPRNFDQVLVVNRTTDAVEMRLGADGNHSVLHEQHNPDYLLSEEGRPTILVADSENDRIVEYERRCAGDPVEAPPADCSWTLAWELGVGGNLTWPRDADRLPNGNTLVTDSLNHRVVEVTPEGEVVWEYYATWGPYDAERVGATNTSAPWTGGSARGPTMRDLNATGAYAVTGSANDPPVPEDAAGGPAAVLADAGLTPLAVGWSHVVPWVKPVWMGGWAFLAAAASLAVGLAWAGAEAWTNRRGIAARLGR
ncbi:aryl-sulfate sulfotransferase [Halosegnis marinus]|uniref:Aryl-sulfate sulfotransferase n=1 Tax=Halosegnis marinus TaxID=3034023 RepID=A0ABD5ZNH9_9EURY|nr:aryl-sulfate sulfotransferase [Halosegnis sp. DT85]